MFLGSFSVSFLYQYFLQANPSTSPPPPSLAGLKISVLLHADMAIISFAETGLRRMLISLADYCDREESKINYNKTKIRTFGNNRIKYR